MRKFFRAVIHLHIFVFVTHIETVWDIVEHEAKEATVFHVVEFVFEKGWDFVGEEIVYISK